MELLFGVAVFVVFIVVILLKTAIVVPQRHEYVVERLGKYRDTLEAGFHVLIPFLDKVAYRRNLKEQPMDIGGQTCITADNVPTELRIIVSPLPSLPRPHFVPPSAKLPWITPLRPVRT